MLGGYQGTAIAGILETSCEYYASVGTPFAALVNHGDKCGWAGG